MQTVIPHIDTRSAAGIEIRPLAASDRDRLSEAFARLSEDTRLRPLLATSRCRKIRRRPKSRSPWTTSGRAAGSAAIPLDSFLTRQRAA